MPFKVIYQIWEPGKLAPAFTTEDRTLAYIELSDRQRKDALTRMDYDITPENLTKAEEYVWLVRRVLKAIRKYYDERRTVSKEQSADNLRVSLALERELDNWNARTRCYLNSHPRSTPDDPGSFAFFQVVEEWRSCWHKYFAYKKTKDKDPNVEREMKKQCFQLEGEIKKYIRLVMKL